MPKNLPVSHSLSTLESKVGMNHARRSPVLLLQSRISVWILELCSYQLLLVCFGTSAIEKAELHFNVIERKCEAGSVRSAHACNFCHRPNGCAWMR